MLFKLREKNAHVSVNSTLCFYLEEKIHGFIIIEVTLNGNIINEAKTLNQTLLTLAV